MVLGRMLSKEHAFVLLAITTAINALTISYCSNLNTGSGFAAVNNQFQSNGACYDTCLTNYAFAILQGANCWCSDYVPAESTSISFCDEPCPGFSTDTCGSQSANLFGYIALTMSPLGTSPSSTASVATPTNVPQTSPVISPSPVTVLETVTASPTVQVFTISPVQSTSSTQVAALIVTTSSPISPVAVITSETPSYPSTTSTWTPSPYASIITVTGQIQTVTITPSVPPRPSETIQVAQATSDGFFSNTGKVVGVFVAVAIIVVAVFFGLLWCCCCRGRRNRDDSPLAAHSGDTMSRQSSKLSHLRFTVKRRSTDLNHLPRVSTSGLNSGSGNEKSPVDTITPVSRRVSGPMRVVDQRLDPDTLWSQEHIDGSHTSIRSFRDDRDYSRRMLRVANPDEENS